MQSANTGDPYRSPSDTRGAPADGDAWSPPPVARPRRSFPIGSIALTSLVIAVAFLAGMLFDRRVVLPNSPAFGSSAASGESQTEAIKKYWEVVGVIQKNYFDRDVANNLPQLTEGAIAGAVNALGDEGHTRYLSVAELKRQEEQLTGTFFGIGAEITQRDGRVQILAPLEDTPAERAGVKPGDIVIKVDDEDVREQNTDYVVSKIRGPKGTPVTITFWRRGRESFQEVTLTIVRDTIPLVHASRYTLTDQNIAWIKLSHFGAKANEQLRREIEVATKEGATALIIDVRNNPGGLLNQAIDVSSQFLKAGTAIVQQRGQQDTKTLTAVEGGIAHDIPIVVLINGNSASAAEIFAGAIRAAGRGTVVGERTFGTGTVLNIFKLSDGSAVMLATAEWLTPDGRSMRRQGRGTGGVEPDVAVPLPIDAPLLSPREAKSMSVDEVLASKDVQLRKAIETLRPALAGVAR